MDIRAIGFIGFGEAGSNLAKGLSGAGGTRLFAYDINTHTPRLGEKIRKRATTTQTSLVESSESLARSCDILLSVVTAKAASDAARQTLPFLEARHFYADLNSVSPAQKQSIGEIISPSGARYVEAVMMSAVPAHLHRVPMLLGGPNAGAFVELLSPHGMRLEVISEEIGAASAVKMCRSIIVKGLEALLLECVMGASRYGADERVLASLADTIPGLDWSKLADYMVGRVVEHGERRAREMEEVAETLRAIGIEPIMAEATARRQEWGGRLGMLGGLAGQTPKSYRDVVRAAQSMSVED
jgi:3-hydroxyisobutyrate dehydrogenase-like beta-hydroxyacid dehydrogenase